MDIKPAAARAIAALRSPRNAAPRRPARKPVVEKLESVFNDADADGVRDTGESAVQGRVVYDDTNDDGVRQAYEPFARTNAQGNYQIPHRGPWAHRVRQEVPAGWRQTSPANLLSNTVLLGNDQQATQKDFGSTEQAGIGGTIFNDRNADGSKGAGEGALAGWTIYLDANRNGALDAGEPRTLSNARGSYAFTVPAGSYQVREVPGAGYRVTTPAKTFYDLTLAAGQTTARFFGNTTNVLISGVVFNDQNRNGVRDAGENPLAGWRVFVDADGDGVMDLDEPAALTDAVGKYRMSAVGAGNRRLQLFLPDHWAATVPASASRKIKLASGGTTSNKNFAARQVT